MAVNIYQYLGGTYKTVLVVVFNILDQIILTFFFLIFKNRSTLLITKLDLYCYTITSSYIVLSSTYIEYPPET